MKVYSLGNDEYTLKILRSITHELRTFSDWEEVFSPSDVMNQLFLNFLSSKTDYSVFLLGIVQTLAVGCQPNFACKMNGIPAEWAEVQFLSPCSSRWGGSSGSNSITIIIIMW